jgi:glucoamylase
VLLDTPAKAAPFDKAAISQLTKHFLANINVNGTGAVIASPGAVPALNNCCPGGYAFHWMRDGALSMDAFQQLDGLDQAFVKNTMKAYTNWVSKMQGLEGTGVDAHTEPKWNIGNETPYSGGWCRPQTDGPGLRARALMRYASTLHDSNSEKDDVWKLITFDLDWLSKSKDSSHELGCDLWEETTANDLLWNKVSTYSQQSTHLSAPPPTNVMTCLGTR